MAKGMLLTLLMMMVTVMLMGSMVTLMGDVMSMFFGPHRTCFHSVFDAVFDDLFLCVVLLGLLNAFGAVSSGKSSGPSFSCCKCAASVLFSGCSDAHLVQNLFASISLAQAQFCSFFFVFLSLSLLLPFPSLAVFVCLVEKCGGKFGRRFLRPGRVWGLVLRGACVSLLPGGGKKTEWNRAAFPAPRQSEGVVLQ